MPTKEIRRRGGPEVDAEGKPVIRTIKRNGRTLHVHVVKDAGPRGGKTVAIVEEPRAPRERKAHSGAHKR